MISRWLLSSSRGHFFSLLVGAGLRSVASFAALSSSPPPSPTRRPGPAIILFYFRLEFFKLFRGDWRDHFALGKIGFVC